MSHTFYKYHGAGNDFLIADNRNGSIHLTDKEITELCHRRCGIGADGLMLLEESPTADFRMVYYNSDGSGGMMCGNGGRCIVAFADRCGIDSFDFEAADGPHWAKILDRAGETCTVQLGMKDVAEIVAVDEGGIHGWFLDTGTRHLVVPVVDIDAVDVATEGKRLRWLERFAPIGTNVNFIQRVGDTLKVRTFEKGVEAETCACGTGIVASAIAWWHSENPENQEGKLVHVDVQSLLGHRLAVDFIPTTSGAKDVSLTGPATCVAEVKPL